MKAIETILYKEVIAILFTIENDKLKVQVNSLGAELWSIVNKEDGTEHLWQGDKKVWPRRAPTLFPHCGKLKGDKYILENETYKSNIHGFVRDYEHKVVESNETSIMFSFTYNEDSLKKYPYAFNFYTIFKLEGNILTHSFEVENVDEKEMYFSLGYHTGFMCPFDNEHTIEEYSLKFEKEETPIEILCNSSGLLTGEEKIYFENKDTINLHNDLFPASFILSNLKSEFVLIVEEKTGRSIRVGIKDYPYVVFWSTPEKVQFICIEPWYGLPDSFDTDGQFIKKRGIQKLAPGKRFSCGLPIEIANRI